MSAATAASSAAGQTERRPQFSTPPPHHHHRSGAPFRATPHPSHGRSQPFVQPNAAGNVDADVKELYLTPHTPDTSCNKTMFKVMAWFGFFAAVFGLFLFLGSYYAGSSMGAMTPTFESIGKTAAQWAWKLGTDAMTLSSTILAIGGTICLVGIFGVLYERSKAHDKSIVDTAQDTREQAAALRMVDQSVQAMQREAATPKRHKRADSDDESSQSESERGPKRRHHRKDVHLRPDHTATHRRHTNAFPHQPPGRRGDGELAELQFMSTGMQQMMQMHSAALQQMMQAQNYQMQMAAANTATTNAALMTMLERFSQPIPAAPQPIAPLPAVIPPPPPQPLQAAPPQLSAVAEPPHQLSAAAREPLKPRNDVPTEPTDGDVGGGDGAMVDGGYVAPNHDENAPPPTGYQEHTMIEIAGVTYVPAHTIHAFSPGATGGVYGGNVPPQPSGFWGGSLRESPGRLAAAIPPSGLAPQYGRASTMTTAAVSPGMPLTSTPFTSPTGLLPPSTAAGVPPPQRAATVSSLAPRAGGSRHALVMPQYTVSGGRGVSPFNNRGTTASYVSLAQPPLLPAVPTTGSGQLVAGATAALPSALVEKVATAAAVHRRTGSSQLVAAAATAATATQPTAAAPPNSAVSQPQVPSVAAVPAVASAAQPSAQPPPLPASHSTAAASAVPPAPPSSAPAVSVAITVADAAAPPPPG